MPTLPLSCFFLPWFVPFSLHICARYSSVKMLSGSGVATSLMLTALYSIV